MAQAQVAGDQTVSAGGVDDDVCFDQLTLAIRIRQDDPRCAGAIKNDVVDRARLDDLRAKSCRVFEEKLVELRPEDDPGMELPAVAREVFWDRAC